MNMTEKSGKNIVLKIVEQTVVVLKRRLDYAIVN